MQRIFLTGLSGSGKSTVGREVARLLGWDCVDTDDLLAERTGLPAGQALLEYGEPGFRQLESEILMSASGPERVVIATGGGAVIAEANRNFMLEHGLVVYLNVSTETAWQRIPAVAEVAAAGAGTVAEDLAPAAAVDTAVADRVAGPAGVGTAAAGTATVAEAAGNVVEARGLYAKAAASWSSYGSKLEHAAALLGEARCLIAAHAAGADVRLRQSRGVAAELGAIVLTAEADALLDRVPNVTMP